VPLDPIPLVPADTPQLSIPDDVSPRAYRAFVRLIKDCGREIYRMPASCEMYLRQYLEGYDEERELLTGCLKAGLPDLILRHAKKDGYREFLRSAADDLRQAAGCSPTQARWAVEAWATAVDRPPEYEHGPVVARPIEPPPGYEEPKPAISERSLRWIMAAIAGFGGFCGGALGNGGLMLFLVVTGLMVDYEFEKTKPGVGDYAVIIFIAVVMLIGGTAGGLGAFAGWMFGRGDAKPWSGASAAFGAAFGISCVLFLCFGPGIITAAAQCFCAFGASFTAAARGGYQR
jgi:hypothetical protein